MSIIVRPTKASSGTDHYIPATTILDNEVDDDLDVIYADHNGNITNANCSAGMALEGVKIASNPNGIGTSQINTGAVTPNEIALKAVTSTKLASDPTIDGNRAVTSDSIKNNAVIARIIKITTVDWTPGGNIGAGAELHNSTGVDRTSALIPLFVEVRTTTDPTGNPALLILKLWLNTNSNIYFVSVANPTASTVSLAGLTFRFYYIPIS